jgi:serine/threonine-protein kinase
MNHFELAPEQWATLRQLLDEALDRPQQERATWLEQLDPQFDAFKPRLRSLLEHAAKATRALPINTLPKFETAQFLADRTARPQSDGAPQAGDSVGPYRLVRLLGEGGMGSVWLAERSDMLVKRQVALKLPHLAWRRARLAERLEREREILVALNHPNIARLYDAGISADRQPFLALEYVEGERIDAYCTRKTLDVPARLRLFLQVARAVAHAHANLIVHRDLKPTNILVTEAGEVKLLDFGIAKLLEDGQVQETKLTQLAGRALTPDYAAPEQILGQPIGTAADVYSLGVVLFELLAGARPYKLRRDSRAALEEAIVQADVSRPSSVAADAKLKKRLAGDLDTIVLKALKKAPAERYGTVDALADDIERHLDRRPVRAQADRWWYRAHRFVLRNRVAVGAASSVAVALIAGAGVAVWQAHTALAEKQRAEQVKDFIASLLKDASPYRRAKPGEVTALDMLRRARERLNSELGAQPEVRLELLSILGQGLVDFGANEEARQLIEPALREAGTALSADAAPVLLSLRLGLAEAYSALGRAPEGRAEVEKALVVMEASGQQTTPNYAQAKLLQALLAVDERRMNVAAEAAEQALRVLQSSSGGHWVHLLEAHQVLGMIHRMEQRYPAAVEHSQRAFELSRKAFAADSTHPRVIDAQMTFGRALFAAGRLEEAIEHMRSAADGAVVTFGEDSFMAGHFYRSLASAQIERGELRDAIANARKSVAILERGPKPGSADHHASRLSTLGNALLAAREPLEAAARLEAAIRLVQTTNDRRALLANQSAYGVALISLGRLQEAVALLSHVVQASEESSPRVHWQAQRSLASAYRAQGRPQAAQQILERSLAKAPASSRRQIDHALTLAELGLVQLELGDARQANELLENAIAAIAAAQPLMTPQRAEVLVAVARAQMQVGSAPLALRNLQLADEFWRSFSPKNRGAGEAAFWLGRCFAVHGNTGEARQAYARAEKILAQSALPSDIRLAQLARRASAG